jgi:hypothetical protein
MKHRYHWLAASRLPSVAAQPLPWLQLRSRKRRWRLLKTQLHCTLSHSLPHN